jgi:hypothetical protein
LALVGGIFVVFSSSTVELGRQLGDGWVSGLRDR